MNFTILYEFHDCSDEIRKIDVIAQNPAGAYKHVKDLINKKSMELHNGSRYGYFLGDIIDSYGQHYSYHDILSDSRLVLPLLPEIGSYPDDDLQINDFEKKIPLNKITLHDGKYKDIFISHPCQNYQVRYCNQGDKQMWYNHSVNFDVYDGDLNLNHHPYSGKIIFDPNVGESSTDVSWILSTKFHTKPSRYLIRLEKDLVLKTYENDRRITHEHFVLDETSKCDVFPLYNLEKSFK